MTKFRTISSHLLHGAPNPQDPRLQPNVHRAMGDIDGILAPFASTQFSQQQRLSTLEGIVNRAVQLAFTLYSQPAMWHINWNSLDGQGNNQVVVFPGLQKVTDDEGRQQTPITFEQPKIISVA